MQNNKEVAVLAGGCFWCVEAVFKRLKGVNTVISGYAASGTNSSTPTYEEVSSGRTEFAEAIQVEFDPRVVSFEKLLEVFWVAHDPTTLNRQGNDVGSQYRSVIFYTSENQQQKAQQSKENLAKSGKYHGTVVTAIEPLGKFGPAEKNHLDYYERNRNQPYCRLVIDPKIQKLYKDFAADIKKEFIK